jgi:hypothetical protein
VFSRRILCTELFLGLGLLVLSSACGDRTSEPAPEASSRGSGPVKPLEVTLPPTWPQTESSPTAARRAGYKVPRVGDDKEDGELLVLFFGTGSNGDRDKQWEPWFEQFDGNAKESAQRGSFDSPAGPVETFEFKGNYKLNLGKQRPGMTKSPVQMVKHEFRMIGAVVKTKDRGNWFVRLVGPDETVLAAREAFLEVLKTAR